MTEYQNTLVSIILTMVTGTITVGAIATIIFFALMLWKLIGDNIKL